MSRSGKSQRSPREHRHKRTGDDSKSKDDDYVSSSPVASPASWNVDRGRSRVRRLSNAFSEDSLRRRYVRHAS